MSSKESKPFIENGTFSSVLDNPDDFRHVIIRQKFEGYPNLSGENIALIFLNFILNLHEVITMKK